MIIKGLEGSPDETIDTINAKFAEMLATMEVNRDNIKITHFERLQFGPNDKPKPIKVTLASGYEKQKETCKRMIGLQTSLH